MSLAQSSVAFVVTALLCWDWDRDGGVEGLHEAVAATTRRFVLKHGYEFHSLVAEVVGAVEQQHGNRPQMQGGGRATGNASTSK
ncbi:hypothetical protein E2562_000216 [Oryza meyeriana var. granulata]|uniref:Uncharacterized protein n=1 Tax=Oryza meyeriana var. granulata TaxID=110450 RepID=A0A6G1CMF2_9ORYZ|nr:hypothetical protein E2562_000216 [Oryza meyeriana var. granulata]